MSSETGGAAPITDPAVIDAADTTAGYRTVIDEQEATELPPEDPNIAAATHDHSIDHEDCIGEPVDDDPDVAAALARLETAAS